jgi:hypothetical protein
MAVGTSGDVPHSNWGLDALRLAASLWWKLFLLLCVATYLPGGILALLTCGPSALASYLTSWGLV